MVDMCEGGGALAAAPSHMQGACRPRGFDADRPCEPDRRTSHDTYSAFQALMVRSLSRVRLLKLRLACGPVLESVLWQK